jgi:hypothetical protein
VVECFAAELGTVGAFAPDPDDRLQLLGPLAERGLFAGWKHLTVVELPPFLDRISGWAFSGCTGLTDVVIPEGVRTIENGAFARCSALKRLAIPASVQCIGCFAFARCTALTTVVLPPTGIICHKAFGWCKQLSHVVVPPGIKREQCAANAFEGCRGPVGRQFRLPVVDVGGDATEVVIYPLPLQRDWCARSFGGSQLERLLCRGAVQQLPILAGTLAEEVFVIDRKVMAFRQPTIHISVVDLDHPDLTPQSVGLIEDYGPTVDGGIPTTVGYLRRKLGKVLGGRGCEDGSAGPVAELRLQHADYDEDLTGVNEREGLADVGVVDGVVLAARRMQPVANGGGCGGAAKDVTADYVGTTNSGTGAGAGAGAGARVGAAPGRGGDDGGDGDGGGGGGGGGDDGNDAAGVAGDTAAELGGGNCGGTYGTGAPPPLPSKQDGFNRVIGTPLAHNPFFGRSDQAYVVPPPNLTEYPNDAPFTHDEREHLAQRPTDFLADSGSYEAAEWGSQWKKLASAAARKHMKSCDKEARKRTAKGVR